MFDNFRNNLALGLARTIGTKNLFNHAFFGFMGGGFATYDINQKGIYLEKGFGTNPDVYAVIKQMSDKHASIPRTVKIVKDKGAKRQLDRLRMQTKGVYTPQQWLSERLLETKAFEEKELDFPLSRPNPLQTWHEIKELEKLFLKTTGNAFYYTPSPEDGANKGVPLELYILPSHLIQIVLKGKIDALDGESPIDHYMLIEGNQYIEFPADQVFQVKYANPFFDMSGSHLYGLSPLRAAVKNIQSSNEALTNNIKTLANGGAFGFVHSKGNTAMDPEQAKQIKSRLQEMDSDSGRLGKITGINHEIGFTKLSLNTDELRPFDFLKHDQKTICNVLEWSDKLLNNDDGGKYDNVKQFRKQVVTDNIMPDNDLINAAFQENFIRKFKGYENAVLESVYDQLPEMQEDLAELMKWIKEAIDTGVISRQEGRVSMKFIKSEDPGMEVITVNQDVIPLSEALQSDFGLNNTTP